MCEQRTGEHVRELVAPTKGDDDLPPGIVTRDEPMRMREDVRELCARASEEPGGGERVDVRIRRACSRADVDI